MKILILQKIILTDLNDLGATQFLSLREPCLGRDPYFKNHWLKLIYRGGVEDTRLEAKAKAKDTKKNPRPRTGMLKAKAKYQGHKRKCSPKKKKKVFTKIFLAISTIKRFPKKFSSASQSYNNSKNSAVLETEDRPIFEDLRPRGQSQGQGLLNVSSRTPPLLI